MFKKVRKSRLLREVFYLPQAALAAPTPEAGFALKSTASPPASATAALPIEFEDTCDRCSLSLSSIRPHHIPAKDYAELSPSTYAVAMPTAYYNSDYTSDEVVANALLDLAPVAHYLQQQPSKLSRKDRILDRQGVPDLPIGRNVMLTVPLYRHYGRRGHKPGVPCHRR